MILANARERLTSQDVELLLDVLGQGDSHRRAGLIRRAEVEGIDVLLDDPDLLQQLVAHRSLTSPSPALFLYTVVRHSLRAAGIDDRRLSDYLAALLLDFGIGRRASRVSPYDDDEYVYLTDLMLALEEASGRREFLLRAHLGNFSLWLAGVFPDYIVARRERKGGPDLRYYETLGAQGFRLARNHRLATELELVEVYDRVADAFGPIRVALNRMSDRWFFPNWHTPDRLLRQVVDGARERS